MKKKLVQKIKPPVDGPLTVSQLMDVVMPKKLNFFKSQVSNLTEKGSKKLNFILPKLGQDHLVSSPANSKDEAKTPYTEPVGDIRPNRQFILQPMSTLSYHLIPSENIQIQIPEPTLKMNNGLSLPLSRTITTPIASNVTDHLAEQVQTSASQHKLPLIVTQQPSLSSALPQSSQGKDTSNQDQNTSLAYDESSNQSGVSYFIFIISSALIFFKFKWI